MSLSLRPQRWWGTGMVTALVAGLVLAASTTAQSPSAPSAPTPPAGYRLVVDDTESIQILLPDSFTDVLTAPAALDDGTQIPQIAGSYDLDAWTSGWTVPGVYFAAYPFADDPRSLYSDIKATSGCGVFGDYDQEGPYFFGLTQAGIRCGDEGTSDWQLIVANPLDQAFSAVVQWSTGPGHLGSPFRPTILGSFNSFGAPLTHEEAAAAIASPAPSPVLSTPEPSLTAAPTD